MTAIYDPRPDWAVDDAEAARPRLETLVAITHEVWGWSAEHTHACVTEFEACEEHGHWALGQQMMDELKAEDALDRYLAGW